MTTAEFILLNIIVPGLLGGIFAPMAARAVRRICTKRSKSTDVP